MIIAVHHRALGPSVYVGPFPTLEDAQNWVAELPTYQVWGFIPLQDPGLDTTPDWNE